MRRWCQAVIFAPPLLTASREGKVLRLAEGVTHSRIMGRNGLVETIRLSITPTANRNSYRVARLVGALPRVACFARNPGLGNRNSVRVAAACVSPSPCPPQRARAHWKPLPMLSPRGGSSFLLCFRWLCGVPSPWGRLGWGLCGAPSPWGRLGWGFGWGLFSCSFHSGA